VSRRTSAKALFALASGLPFGLLSSILLVASCDTGGEPPTFDAGHEAANGDVTHPTDVSISDTPVFDSPLDVDVVEPDAACGLLGNACCKGESGAGTCSKGKCTDFACESVCEPASCGNIGGACCFAPESPCVSGATCVAVSTDGGTAGGCAACGDPGDPCCALNVCNNGGCCIDGTCASEGTVCGGSDGGVCSSGGCGSCGSAGQPCCGTVTQSCTAPGTLCEGEGTTTTDAGEGGTMTMPTPGRCKACGGVFQACCEDSTCSSGLSCVGATCQTVGDASCGD
jgi:hypothetical protein